MNWLRYILVCLFWVGQAGCVGTQSLADEPLKVVTSISILADMVTRIGGSHVMVTSLVGIEADAHDFQPTPGNARELQKAKLLVVNGLGLEPWLSRLLQATGYTGDMVTASAGIKPRNASAGVRMVDPHAWQDVANGRAYVATIAAALGRIDPVHEAAYQAAARSFDQELASLDQEMRSAFAALPAANRRIVTDHDAFGYYGDAYGLTLLAARGLSREGEAAARATAALIRLIRAEKVRAVFFEAASDPRLMERIAAESGANIGGRLYTDTLSAANGPAATYVAMIRHNTGMIIAALAGKP